MAKTQSPEARTGADPDIPQQEAPSRAPELTEAAQRLRRVRANLRLPDRPFAPPSRAYDEGLRALRLRPFVRLNLSVSGAPRPDLVAELIANYKSTPGCNGGWSSVRGKEIEVSLDEFAKAFYLPGRPSFCPPAGVDPAVVAFAAQEFAEVYFPPSKRCGLVDAALGAVKDGRVHDIDWTVLIWVQVMAEIKQLVEENSTDTVNYYGLHLQWLILVQRPELFRLPPEPAGLRPQKKRGSNRAAGLRPQRRCSESDMPRDEARSEQIDATSKKIQSAFEKFDAASMKIDLISKKFDMQKIESRSKQIDMASKKIDSASKKIDATSKKIDSTFEKLATVSKEISASSKKFDSASKIMGVTSKKFDSAFKMINATYKVIKTTSKQLDARAKQLGEKDDDMQAMESLNQALLTKERKSNDELQGARKMLIEALQKFTIGRSDIVVKRMGELDARAFVNACAKNVPHEDAQFNSAIL